ncbi:MAG: serine/threonine protein kinase [Bacteroidota bacterium]|jgi:serine/threonine-protein kinase|nr:serine/threonine protein kinase [Bacteroidota bacterium]
MAKQYKKGQTFGNWTLTSYLGGGGNGEVWACLNSKKETRAIKLLKKIKVKSYDRFVDETFVIEKNTDITGIIPIIEKHLPKELTRSTPYFIMPLATPTENLLKGKSIEEKINAIIEIAETLYELHKRKIYHRDIKPANILFYDSRFALADFGLVDYPNKKEISLKNEEIGPKWTMAPEMKRTSSEADPAKADIYSLAKTMWIYLTENAKGFDGQYSTESIIHLKKFYPQNYTSPIDNLLIACTDNDPSKRPSIQKFIHSLTEWRELEENFHARNLEQWFEIQAKLFPASIPKRVIWEDINDIIKVLKIVCSYDDLNHVFLPNGGGLDLDDVRISNEEGCIELDFQLIDIIKPKRLLFESFGYHHDWNYFRLEADDLDASGVYEAPIGKEPYEKIHSKEELTEVESGVYENYDYLESLRYQEYDDEENRPKNPRHITRWLRGNFVIFCKRSIYNLTNSTYDGRHNKMTTDEFREYIEKHVTHSKEKDEKSSFFEKLIANAKRKSPYGNEGVGEMELFEGD